MSLDDPANQPTWRGPVSMFVRFALAAGVAILIFAPQVFFGGGLSALLGGTSAAPGAPASSAEKVVATAQDSMGAEEGYVASTSGSVGAVREMASARSGADSSARMADTSKMAAKKTATNQSRILGPVGALLPSVTRYPRPEIPYLATPERARAKAEEEYRARSGGSARGGEAVPLERLEGLPSPIQGKITPFNPPVPGDDSSAPPLEELARSVTALASQFRAETLADTELAGAPGKRGRSFVFSVRAEYANSFVTKLRSSVGAYGSVSPPSALTKSKSSVTTEDVSKLQAEMEDLNIQREGLLKDFYEDAKPVVDITKRIDDLRERIEKARSQPKGLSERRIVSVTVLGA
jgi:hypothetical protein